VIWFDEGEAVWWWQKLAAWKRVEVEERAALKSRDLRGGCDVGLVRVLGGFGDQTKIMRSVLSTIRSSPCIQNVYNLHMCSDDRSHAAI
jgi:hypothetical protein